MLVGCSNKSGVFSLDDEYYGNGELVEIESLDELNQMVEDKVSFALFVYMPGCTSCAAFKPVLKSFVSKNEVTVLEISSAVIGDDRENSVMTTIEYAPSVILYDKGKPVAALDAMSDDDAVYYKTVEAFSRWWTKYCELKIS